MVRPKCLTSPSLTMDLVHNIDWFIATSVWWNVCHGFVSEVDSPSGGVANLSGRLSDLSITSGISSEGNSLLGGGNGEGKLRREDDSHRSHCCRSCKRTLQYYAWNKTFKHLVWNFIYFAPLLLSVIRPPLSHPHTRGLRKSDPVTRYHEFRQVWETYKAPGEKNRNGLRWHIRVSSTIALSYQN